MHPQCITDSEDWRPVVGWEGWYSVSNLGRVRRERRAKGAQVMHLMHGTPSKGYRLVNLTRDGRSRICKMHALVAAAFLGPKPPNYEVNHKNGVKDDNRAANLEYVTRHENMAHAVRLGLTPSGERSGARRHPERSHFATHPEMSRGINNPSARLTEQDVREIRNLYASGQGTHRSLAAQFHVSKRTVADIVHHRAWTHLLS